MTFKQIARITVVAMSLAFAANAFAATNSGELFLANAASVNGTVLKAGAYKVKWEGTGDNLTVSILEGKKVMATAPAHMMDLGSKASGNSVLVTSTDGKPTISQIRFSGSEHALALGGDSAKPSGE
jgi:hypothetical protein